MKATKQILLLAELSAVVAGCKTQQHLPPLSDAGRLADKIGVPGIARCALKDAAASCSEDWCWVVVQDVKSGDVVFADGMVRGVTDGVNMCEFGAPWNDSVLSAKEMRNRIACAKSEPSAASEPGAAACGIRMDCIEHIYPVYGTDSGHANKSSSVAVASGFTPEMPKGSFYVAVCFAVPKDAGEEVAKKAARTALQNACSGIRKAL